MGDLAPDAPVTRQRLLSLVKLPEAGWNIFGAPVAEIAARAVAQEPWIRRLRVERRLPDGLVLWPELREPSALLQRHSGSLAYVDGDGTIFGSVRLTEARDLPLISENGGSITPAAARAVMSWMAAWDAVPELKRLAQVSSVQVEGGSVSGAPAGYQALILYPAGRSLVRASLVLGQDLDAASEPELLARLARVVRYLSDHAIVARQIRADTGKKLVVKSGRDS